MAGIDFDDDSNGSIAGNQLVTHTFDIQVTNANQDNQKDRRSKIAASLHRKVRLTILRTWPCRDR